MNLGLIGIRRSFGLIVLSHQHHPPMAAFQSNESYHGEERLSVEVINNETFQTALVL